MTDIRPKAYLDPLGASIWDPLGQPKSIQKHSGSDLQWHHVSDLDFKGWSRVVPPRGEAALHPGSRALVPGYMYTRIKRALRARSILSNLALEAKSLAGRDWVCTPNLNPATLLCPHEIFFLGAFKRAASCYHKYDC